MKTPVAGTRLNKTAAKNKATAYERLGARNRKVKKILTERSVKNDESRSLCRSV
jgi:hypothetical protein